jgi:predicted TIM-barrel fold metal-dependent hydrolase
VDLLPGTGVYVDTSSSLFALAPERAAEIIRAFGVDHVLFGSDYPMWNPGEEKCRLEALALTAAEKQAIFYDNAARLLNL